MGYQSEYGLEENVVKQLQDLGYERVSLRNETQLKENFRRILNERNADKLEGTPISDSEFKRIMIDISDKSVFESAQILRDKYVLERDDETKVYISLMNIKKWCQNTFQVTNQVSVNDTHKSRYDVTVLINGLPLVQIELKRSGVAITEAFNQIERYRRQNYTGLFRFIQMFVVSNKMETRYYANSDQKIMKSHMFYWSDEKNERINMLKDFIESFLEPCHIAKMISRYMIINETDKILMALRPYQVYAVEALLNRAIETNNNGYIWHTTGSGKTLTSFKASQILAQEPDIKKVIFLVDRKDLDGQTLGEFNKFESDSVDRTFNTKKLLKQMDDPTRKLIITTIQKMDNAIKSGHPVMERYKEDKVVFIIDECHRTQFGSMHRIIRQHFGNAQYFGFTGTPRFEENASQDGRATADIFGECLHHYLIKDAIRDGNVLGFSVEYMNTFDRSEKITEDGYVNKINDAEIWMADERVQKVAEHIIANHNKKTRDQMYTGMLTVQSIPMAIQYYRVFQKLKKQGVHNFNVTTIFSYQDNEAIDDTMDEQTRRDILEDIIQTYNETFDKNFSTDTFDGYFNDVSNRVKKGLPDQKLDILIVVDMFLTGFDSKKLNTLYVDRNLQHHTLIQAYSRTNRVEEPTKPYGNIVAYRNLKEKTDEAIELFSKTDNTDTVLSLSFQAYLTKFKQALIELFELAETPQAVDQLEREEDQRDFVIAYRELAKHMQKLKTFDEFAFDKETLGIDEQTYEDYKGKYLDIYDKVIRPDNETVEGESILDNIDFNIEILRNDLINVQYILDLLNQIDLSDTEQQEKDIKEIRKVLDKADDDQLRLKSDLIRTFLDKVVPNLNEGDSIDDAYYNYESKVKVGELEQFSEETEYPLELLKSLVKEFEFSGQLNNNLIEEGVSGGLLIRTKKIKRVKSFIKEMVKKYSV
ncbi:MAG: type I restriction endonuclease subunit R [Tetragenococcus koreensis]|uniref:Type I restriction enzyme endonuclease subunit n=3 Tax=Staphylococcus equorum TaxID=246432 RepID=A0AAW7AJK7_9STAP|nr:type I restriction endonuclease subunit R [Staphylococcus equorum]MDN6541624.1 type I restriction endonuclease subunit R [Tetragenococcus koreensis]MDN6606572.1 type I restriction endonuclease subunit R [Tetragenococcus halophilus]MDK9861395.1 type I restriction endonuclease subunit R [Staphylococcus equorum]MDK9867099.1 type I restriction endonuclease subunit R [Staphylococcus equorum]MDK9873061.1 type I restriction endonuclease subunit R [Staphylococcus equorum]